MMVFSLTNKPTDFETLAAWMIARGYSTGHGDTVVDLLVELDRQIMEERRRHKMIAELAEEMAAMIDKWMA
jgi:hypothetical protein